MYLSGNCLDDGLSDFPIVVDSEEGETVSTSL